MPQVVKKNKQTNNPDMTDVKCKTMIKINRHYTLFNITKMKNLKSAAAVWHEWEVSGAASMYNSWDQQQLASEHHS